MSIPKTIRPKLEIAILLHKSFISGVDRVIIEPLSGELGRHIGDSDAALELFEWAKRAFPVRFFSNQDVDFANFC